jgi:hypothetical protein
MNPIIEKDCTIKHDGHEFTAGGSYFMQGKSGRIFGAVYVNPKAGTVTTWHGETIAKIDTFTPYRGNFCKMARVTFTFQGRKMIGDYCPDWADLCKVRSTK